MPQNPEVRLAPENMENLAIEQDVQLVGWHEAESRPEESLKKFW